MLWLSLAFTVPTNVSPLTCVTILCISVTVCFWMLLCIHMDIAMDVAADVGRWLVGWFVVWMYCGQMTGWIGWYYCWLCPVQKKMATYRHWSVSLYRDPDDVSHCRILSADKAEWRLISATLCGWRRCFVADQLWFMTRKREKEEEVQHCARWGADTP